MKRLLRKGYLRPEWNGTVATGWGRLARQQPKKMKRFRAIKFSRKDIMDKDLFRERCLMGMIRFDEKRHRYLTAKSCAISKKARARIKITYFDLSGKVLGMMFGKSESWGIKARQFLKERNVLKVKRIRDLLGTDPGKLDHSRYLDGRVFWSSVCRSYIREKVAKVRIVWCPEVCTRVV